MNPLGAFFHQLNLLRMFSPQAYQGFSQAMGYAAPDQVMAYMQQQQQQYQAYAQMLQRNHQAMEGAQRMAQTIPPSELKKLGTNPNLHQVGNVTVALSKDGAGIAANGPNRHEILGAFTVLRSRFDEGSTERKTLEGSIKQLTAELR